jgi:hypothetical protein
LYVRLVIGAALVGIGYGYYRQLNGWVEMTPFLIFQYAVRGALIGALIWAFELFFVQGPHGNRLARLPRGTIFAVRIAVYVVLFEAGYFAGAALFVGG